MSRSDIAADSDILQQKRWPNFSRPMEVGFYQGPKFFGGSGDLQKGENRLKMKSTADNLHLQELMETSIEFQNS